jgi:hypothetical protein
MDDDATELSEECRQESNELSTVIQLFNQMQLIRNSFLDYINVDIRQICASTSPLVKTCNIDWSDQLVVSSSGTSSTTRTNNLEPVCSSADNGQYVESAFRIDCTKDTEVLQMTNHNVPGCIGRVCSPRQAEFLFQDDHAWLAEHYAVQGWSCTTELLDVYAPNYVYVPPPENTNPDVGILEPVPSPAPVVAPLADGVFTAEEDYGLITDGAVPQFGALWKTFVPTPAPPPSSGSGKGSGGGGGGGGSNGDGTGDDDESNADGGLRGTSGGAATLSVTNTFWGRGSMVFVGVVVVAGSWL